MCANVYDMLLALVTLLLGSGSGAFFTWRYQRSKSKAEAKKAETDAARELQDVYQQLIADVKADRNEQKEYINELKADRRSLREECEAQRKRQAETDENVRQLQREVARHGRLVESIRPFLCGKLNCNTREHMSVPSEPKQQQS